MTPDQQQTPSEGSVVITPFDLLSQAARRTPHARAVSIAGIELTFQALLTESRQAADVLRALGAGRGDRIALYGEKSPQLIAVMMAAWSLGAIVVPVNGLLKPGQVLHVVQDSEATLLWTTEARRRHLFRTVDMRAHVDVLTDYADPGGVCRKRSALDESADHGRPPGCTVDRGHLTDNDASAILYTSGSTGMPKGVVLSNRNIVSGAQSVAGYLQIAPDDVVLGVLPLGFDAGLSQLMISLWAGACYVGVDYLLPSEVTTLCRRERVTSITAVPPLWAQLMEADWTGAAESVRSFANTGGHMPAPLLRKLRQTFRNARPYLMYGFTEAFRSTYLDPAEVDRRPGSIGKAVPNADVRVLRADGSECDVGEPGELVHRGSFVTLGYWKDPERTREKFRSVPVFGGKLARMEIAAWSGDIVRRDAEGYLYYVGRNDEMLKIMGHRVSPSEVEVAVYATGLVKEVAAYGAPVIVHGDYLVIAVVPVDPVSFSVSALLRLLRDRLANYMVPQEVFVHEALPRNANGKFDVAALKAQLRVPESFSERLLQATEA